MKPRLTVDPIACTGHGACAELFPERIELDVEGLEEGTHITAGELTLPRGASLVVDPETLIVAISVPSSTLAAEDEIAELDAAVAAAQALESEAETEGESESESE